MKKNSYQCMRCTPTFGTQFWEKNGASYTRVDTVCFSPSLTESAAAFCRAPPHSYWGSRRRTRTFVCDLLEGRSFRLQHQRRIQGEIQARIWGQIQGQIQGQSRDRSSVDPGMDSGRIQGRSGDTFRGQSWHGSGDRFRDGSGDGFRDESRDRSRDRSRVDSGTNSGVIDLHRDTTRETDLRYLQKEINSG